MYYSIPIALLRYSPREGIVFFLNGVLPSEALGLTFVLSVNLPPVMFSHDPALSFRLDLEPRNTETGYPCQTLTRLPAEGDCAEGVGALCHFLGVLVWD